MNDKAYYLTLLRAEFDRWENLLNGLTEQQIMSPMTPSHWTIKDLMAHLRAWQQRTVARMEAGLGNHEPVFPAWPEDLDPNAHDVDQINAWIYDQHRSESWAAVHQNWRDTFLRLIELTEAIPEEDLLKPGRYTWMWNNEPLAFVLAATVEHHHIDHYQPLLAWLREHKIKLNAN
jgi:hypothetical protein